MAYLLEPKGTQSASTGTVLVTHGWASAIVYMTGLVDAIRAAGFRVVGLDLPGHGEAEGRSLSMLSSTRALSEAERQFGPFAGVVAHSFGGASSVIAASGLFGKDHRFHPARMVLIGAPGDFGFIFDDFARLVKLSPTVFDAMLDHARALSGYRPAEIQLPRLLAKSAVPTLVIHAQDDKEVPFAQAEAYAQAGPTVEGFWNNGQGHRRIVNDGETIARTIAFLKAEAKT